MNIHFDTYAGESSVSPKSMDYAMELLEQKKMLVEDKGAVLANLDEYKLGKVVVRKGDGTSIYITRDLGGAAERYEKHGFDRMVYVIAAQQDYHCKQFFKMLDCMGYEWADRLKHVNFGEYCRVHGGIHSLLIRGILRLLLRYGSRHVHPKRNSEIPR